MNLLGIWEGCNSLHVVTVPGAKGAFASGAIHDVLYFLNMVNSDNLPFIDCVMAALTGGSWT